MTAREEDGDGDKRCCGFNDMVAFCLSFGLSSSALVKSGERWNAVLFLPNVDQKLRKRLFEYILSWLSKMCSSVHILIQ